jgi:hypothetical protein
LQIRHSYLGSHQGRRNASGLAQSAEGAKVTTFDKREEGFEKKFAIDEELKFKAEARRNKLLGLWAAEKLGITGEAASAYAKEVIAAEFEPPGDGDVLHKVLKDLIAKGNAVTEDDISAKMAQLFAVAVAQVKAGT